MVLLALAVENSLAETRSEVGLAELADAKSSEEGLEALDLANVFANSLESLLLFVRKLAEVGIERVEEPSSISKLACEVLEEEQNSVADDVGLEGDLVSLLVNKGIFGLLRVVTHIS